MLGVIIKILGTVMLLAACVIAALFMLDRMENPESEFSTYAEMEASGLIGAGWIPAIIPRSAYEISETHNLDTRIVHMTFRFRLGDIDIPEDLCNSISNGTALVFSCSEGILTLSDDGRGHFTSEPISEFPDLD